MFRSSRFPGIFDGLNHRSGQRIRDGVQIRIRLKRIVDIDPFRMDLGRVQLGDHVVSKIAPARIAKALRKADYGSVWRQRQTRLCFPEKAHENRFRCSRMTDAMHRLVLEYFRAASSICWMSFMLSSRLPLQGMYFHLNKSEN